MAATDIGGNDFVQFKLYDRYRNRADHEVGENLRVPDMRAQMAQDLLRTWGMVQAMRGKEDSAGRGTLELMPVRDVVARAFDMTAIAFEEMERRGWLVKLNRPPELDEEDK